MFETDSLVLVHLISAFNPAVFAGRVVRPIGPEGAELVDAVMVKRCPGGKWGKLAEGDKECRREAIYEYGGTVKFASCAYFRQWAGNLPEAR